MTHLKSANSGRKLILWPRGLFLFASTNIFRRNYLNCDEVDFFAVAMEILLLQSEKHCKAISRPELEGVIARKFGIADPNYALAIYSLCLCVEQPGVESNISTIPLAIAFLDYCRLTEAAKRQQNIPDWINRHLEKLSYLLILPRIELNAHERQLFREHFRRISCCDVKTHIRTQRDNLAKIPNIRTDRATLLEGFDILLEGALIESPKPIAVASIVPKRFSQLYNELNHSSSTTDTTLADLIHKLCALISRSLQDDMFSLYGMNDHFRPKTYDNLPSRSITSTYLAEHRKISIRRWDHIEILTSPLYAGSNLRIVDLQEEGEANKSPIFCLQFLKSAAVCGVKGDGKGRICLGPVETLTLLRKLKGLTVCVISHTVVIEDCEDVVLFTHTISPIIFTGKCRNIRLAPYNVYYTGLTQELRNSGLAASFPQYNNATDFLPKIINLCLSKDMFVYSKLDPRQFYIQPTPFVEPGGESVEVNLYMRFLVSIPSDYLRQWHSLRIVLNDVRDKRLISPNSPNFSCAFTFLSVEDREYLAKRVARLGAH